MMTLKELKGMVEVAENKKDIPGAVMLHADSVIVAKEVINNDTEITAYKNGYVLYKSGKRVTVFPLHACGEYNYGSVSQDSHVVGADIFEHENWYVRLVLEGEDRISRNIEKTHFSHCVSYSAVSEEWGEMASNSNDMEQEIVDREYVRELLDSVGDRAAYALEKFFMEKEQQVDIAKELDINKASVSKLIRSNLNRIRNMEKMDQTNGENKKNK